MRTLVTAFLLGGCLVASSAMAQQHPWVPSDVYAGAYTSGLSIGTAPARTYGRIRKGDTIEPSGWRTGKPATDELYDESCHSSHPVFSCPGTM